MSDNSRRGIDHQESIWQIVYIDFLTMLVTVFLIFAFAERGGASDSLGSQKFTLPGDNSFATKSATLNEEMKTRIHSAFKGLVLSRSLIWISGHTDYQGKKEENLQLGFDRAKAVYNEIVQAEPSYAGKAVLCTAADNLPFSEVSETMRKGNLTAKEKSDVEERNRNNRRIEVEMRDFRHNDVEISERF